MVEDSGNGVAASVAAGLRTLVTLSSYTAEEDFTGASLVVTSLGDAAEPASVIADPIGLSPGPQLDLAVLTAILHAPGPQEER